MNKCNKRVLSHFLLSQCLLWGWAPHPTHTTIQNCQWRRNTKIKFFLNYSLLFFKLLIFHVAQVIITHYIMVPFNCIQNDFQLLKNLQKVRYPVEKTLVCERAVEAVRWAELGNTWMGESVKNRLPTSPVQVCVFARGARSLF